MTATFTPRPAFAARFRLPATTTAIKRTRMIAQFVMSHAPNVSLLASLAGGHGGVWGIRKSNEALTSMLARPLKPLLSPIGRSPSGIPPIDLPLCDSL